MVLNSDQYWDIINAFIGVAGLVIALRPFLGKKEKFLEYPFGEYNTAESALLAKRSGLLWKTNWAVFIIIILIMYMYVFRLTDIGFLGQSSRYDFIIIYIILFVSIGIKDIFHNICAYKKKTEKLFNKYFDSIERLHQIVIIEIMVFLGECLLSFALHIEIKIFIFIILATLSIFFCLFRMIEEMCEYIHLRKVNSLSIKMTDGIVYKDVKEYVDLGNVIRITDAPHTVRYLSKESIISITKILDSKCILNIIREKSKKSKQTIKSSDNKSQ